MPKVKLMEVNCEFTLKVLSRLYEFSREERSRDEIYDEVHTNSNGQPCGSDKSYT